MMATADVLNMLLQAALASSAATVLVLLVRRPLRRVFGAGVAYAAWGLVPAAAVAVLLPTPAIPPAGGAFVTMPVFVVGAGQAQAASSPLDLIGIAWLAGCVMLAVHFARQQRRFVRALGCIRLRDDGLYQAEASVGLPAAIGAWRPRIVLPADFGSRYSPEQQRLMQAHESVHVARGDLLANLLAAVLRCLFWFNPLLHYAVRCFRHDQELACDQRVMARHPQARQTYGEAMFKTQLAAQMLPLGCHWGHGHPLRERIEMLKQPVPTLKRMLIGSALVSALVSGGAFAAWASQPGNGTATKPASKHVETAPAQIAAAVPHYPKAALDQGVGGRVLLIVDVAVDGSVAKAVVERSQPAGLFDAAAMEAVRQWKFKPATRDGRPVSSKIRVPIDFDPEGDPGKRTGAPQAARAAIEEGGLPGKRAKAWSSYEQLVGSLSASWEKPAPPPGDDC